MKVNLILTAIVILFLSGLQAQVDRSKRPLPGPPPKIEIGSYQKQVLANGLTVILVEDHKLPRVSYRLEVDYAPVFEGEQKGFVDFTGSLLGTGSAGRTKDQINDELDFIGARVNFGSRGFFATCLKKHNEQMIGIVAEALIQARFNQEELDKIRKQTLSGLAAEKTSPEAIAGRISNLVVYGPAHPYGPSPTEATVNAISLDRCISFYQDFFRPNISYLVIVGDITMAEAMPLVEKHFSAWEKKEVPYLKYPNPEPPGTNTVSLVDRPQSVQSVIRVTYPVQYKPSDPEYQKGRVMNTILGGGTFRLFNNLREEHGYTYGAYSQLNPDKFTGVFEASADVRNPVTDSAIREILSEMRRITLEPVPAEELEMVKNYMSGTFALSLEKPETVAGFALNIEKFGLPRDYYEKYLGNLAAVTSEDVLQAARKLIKPDRCNLVVVGKAEEIAKPLAALTPGTKIRYFDAEGKEYDPSLKLKPAPEGMTAQVITEKYLDAIGGRKKLSKVKDVTLSMSTTMQGMTIGFKNYRKAPNKLLVEVSAGGMVMSKQVFDGSKALVTSPMGNEEPEGEDLEAMKREAVLNPELDYAAHGIQANLLGIEEVRGNAAYKVELLEPGGKKNYVYYDTGTFLKVRETNDQGVTDYSDYRDVKGIRFPFLLEAEIQGQTLKLEVGSIEINSKLKDEIFKI